MQNHRPLQKQYKAKSTVKHHFPAIIITILKQLRLDISLINRDKRDRFGNEIKLSSGGGGNTECSNKYTDLYKIPRRKRYKVPTHPDSVSYVICKKVTKERRVIRYYGVSRQIVTKWFVMSKGKALRYSLFDTRICYPM